MADQGSIGDFNGYSFIKDPTAGNCYLNMSFYSGGIKAFFPGILQLYSPIYSNTLSGTVKDVGGNPLENYPVGLYQRSTMKLINKTLSAADGTYSFTFLSNSQDFFITGLDATETYDADTRDNLTPGS